MRHTYIALFAIFLLMEKLIYDKYGFIKLAYLSIDNFLVRSPNEPHSCVCYTFIDGKAYI